MFSFTSQGATATMEPPTVGMNGHNRLPEFNGFSSPSPFIGQMPMNNAAVMQPTAPVSFAGTPWTGVIPQIPTYNTVPTWNTPMPCTPWGGVSAYQCTVPTPALPFGLNAQPFGFNAQPFNFNQFAQPVTLPNYNYALPTTTVSPVTTPQPIVQNINPLTTIPTPMPFASIPTSFGVNPWLNAAPSPFFANSFSGVQGFFPGFVPTNVPYNGQLTNGLGCTSPGINCTGSVNTGLYGQVPVASGFTNRTNFFGTIPTTPFVQGFGAQSILNPVMTGIQNTPFGFGNANAGLVNPYTCINGVCNTFGATPFSIPGASCGTIDPILQQQFVNTLNGHCFSPWTCNPISASINNFGFNSLGCNPLAVPYQTPLASNFFCPIA